ncbi:MAG: hypothetical protein ACTSQO_13015 [Candidatus Helarchaeota archaeon]
MVRVIREKVGFKQKLLASIGKRLMFRKQKKISKLLINLSYREIIRLLVEVDGSLEKALNTVFELSSHAGHDFLMEWVEEGSVIFSNFVGDHALWIKAGYYSFTGDNIKYIKYFPPEKEGDPHRVIWRIDKCFLCSGMNYDNSFKIEKKDLEKYGYGIPIAGIFQTTVNMINEYVGIKFEGKVRETKCMLKGDPYGEFVAEFYPKKED